MGKVQGQGCQLGVFTMDGAPVTPVISTAHVQSRCTFPNGFASACGLLPLCWDFWSSCLGSKQRVHSSAGDTRYDTCRMPMGERWLFREPVPWEAGGGLDQSLGVCDNQPFRSCNGTERLFPPVQLEGPGSGVKCQTWVLSS